MRKRSTTIKDSGPSFLPSKQERPTDKIPKTDRPLQLTFVPDNMGAVVELFEYIVNALRLDGSVSITVTRRTQR